MPSKYPFRPDLTREQFIADCRSEAIAGLVFGETNSTAEYYAANYQTAVEQRGFTRPSFNEGVLMWRNHNYYYYKTGDSFTLKDIADAFIEHISNRVPDFEPGFSEDDETTTPNENHQPTL
jgi:hypothetical protein